MIVLGITGSIGMGKSTVAALLRNRTIPVHEADTTVHHLLGAEGKGVKPVAAAFPDALAKNEKNQSYIDRTLLSRVLADPANLKKLEDILHPLVYADSEQFKTAMAQNGHMLIALDIPLLFETQAEQRVDFIICASADPAIQRQRVLARPGMTEEKLAHILSRQMPDAEKRRRADFILDTGKALDETRKDLDQILNTIAKKTGTTFTPATALGSHR
jgi:dephospho-CoA kinase